MVELANTPNHLWIKAVRRLGAVEIFYSYDDKEYKMTRTCYLEDNSPVQAGIIGTSPNSDGFEAIFENFKVTQLADLRRLEWVAKQQ